MKHTSRRRKLLALASGTALAAALLPAGARAATAEPGAPAPTAGAATSADPARVNDPNQVLGPSWRTSTDRAVTTIGDDNGLNVLVADASSAYQWRTAASLSEPGFDTPQWIGQDCVTGSGKYAAVVYAPWSFANDPDAFEHGAFAAIVNLDTGAVRKLPSLVSLSYYSPGCGTGDTVALSAFDETAASKTTNVQLVDAATGRVLQHSIVAGQVTSPVPYGSGVAASLGDSVISVGSDGAPKTLTTGAGIPFELHPDRQGGLAFEVPTGKDTVQVRRYAAGGATLAGSGVLGQVELTGAGGDVFLIGPQAKQVKPASGAGWKLLGGPANTTPSTQGQLVLTSVSNHVDASELDPAVRSALGQQAQQSVSKTPNSLISVSATVTGNGKKTDFTFMPSAMQPASGSAASPALTHMSASVGPAAAPGSKAGSRSTAPSSGAKAGNRPAASAATAASTAYSTTNVDDGANADDVTWDPVRGCAVARNDPTIQSFQATAQQIEWAADLAVQGELTSSRGVNWEGSGMSVSWTPQGMFPLQPLDGGGTVPAQVLLGVLAQESNTMQASPHAVDAETGNFNQGGFYGNPSTTDPAPDTTWADVDCGYGAGQVTTGMTIGYTGRVADGSATFTTAQEQQAIATDYASNIAATLNILIDKWNQLYSLGILANGGSSQYIENWWFALWAYNAGVEPAGAQFGNTSGCNPGPSCTDNGGAGGNWGLGWSNNPADPAYPADRVMFNDSLADIRTPQNWSYPEKVVGWAASPLTRYNYASGVYQNAYAAATYPTGVSASTAEPSHSQFCSPTLDDCVPDGATDSTGAADSAGLCTLADSHCWLHAPVTWTGCASYCGTQTLTYTSSSARPSFTDIYAPDGCTSPGSGTGDTVPAGAVIVDGPQSFGNALCSATPNWTSQGTMSFFFPESENSACTSQCIMDQGKIDFHQIGAGLDGHMWFSHMINPPTDSGTSYTDDSMTATWAPPSTTAGWTRIEVHVPKTGATTRQADYRINLGNGQFRHRLVNQYQNQNTWIDLGSFDLSSGASISLSNYNTYVSQTDGGDVAFDAVAFVPTVKPAVQYVALGDSYSSGESVSPYLNDSDLTSSTGVSDYCHRSNGAYPYQITWPGLSSQTIQQASAGNGPADFAFLACSGAETVDLTASAVNPNNTWNTDWNNSTANESDYGEPYEIDASGYLDPETTLVTISVGGNDARFADVLTGCLQTATICTDPGYYLKRASNGVTDPQQLITYEPEVIAAEQAQLEDVYKAIHAQAPNAEVLVLGYPHLFPPSAQFQTGCALASYFPITGDVVDWMNNMSDDLNNSIQGAISATQSLYPSMNIKFVDPRPTFEGHGVCSTDPWINGIVDLGSTSSFHPMAVGHTAEAALVNSSE